MLHVRRVVQKVRYKQKLGLNGADFQIYVGRTPFPALDVRPQAVVEVVAVSGYKVFKGEEGSQLLPNLTMSLSLVEACFSTS